MDIKVNVDKQKLKVATNLKTYVSGTQEFIKFTFNFVDNSWDNLTTFAQFKQGSNAYNKYLDENNSVYLPSEIQAGECELILSGTHQNVIAVTGCLKLKIEENYLVSDAQSTEISNSLYNQLVTKIGSETLKTESETIIGAINELYNMIKAL